MEEDAIRILATAAAGLLIRAMGTCGVAGHPRPVGAHSQPW